MSKSKINAGKKGVWEKIKEIDNHDKKNGEHGNKSICPYCGCGCYINFIVKNTNKNNNVDNVYKKVVAAKPIIEDPVSLGKPCIKGITSFEVLYGDKRYGLPLIRENKNKKFRQVSWEEAYSFISKNIGKLRKDDIAFYISSPATNEDCFLFQRLAREYFKSDNIDSCARLCHTTSCFAFKKAFNVSRMPSKFDELRDGDCILIVGTDPKFTYPVLFNRILEAKNKGAKVIYVGEYKNATSRHADLFIQVKNGSELALLNCILNLLCEMGAVKIPINIRECIKMYHIDETAKVCGISDKEKKRIAEAVLWIAKSKRFRLCYGMGLAQHTYGVSNVLACCNLVIAKRGKIFSMRGKSNIQGVGDMLCGPIEYGDTIVASIFMFPVKALYIVESNIGVSLPNLNEAYKKFKDMFIIMQSPYMNYTAKKFANVFLPCSMWLEREGTFTNAESRVRKLNKIVEGVVDGIKTKANWEIFYELGKRLGIDNLVDDWSYSNVWDIWRGIKKSIDGYRNIEPLKIGIEGSFVDYKVRYKKYNATKFTGFEELTSKKFPFVLITARNQYAFCTGEYSERSKTLVRLGKENNERDTCYINNGDFKKLFGAKNLTKNIARGCFVRIVSRVGSVRVRAIPRKGIPKGLVVASFHSESVRLNRIVPVELSPIVEEPNLKRVAVRIEAIK